MQTKLIHLPKREACSPGPISPPGLWKNSLHWCCLSFQDQLSSPMTKFSALKKKNLAEFGNLTLGDVLVLLYNLFLLANLIYLLK